MRSSPSTAGRSPAPTTCALPSTSTSRGRRWTCGCGAAPPGRGGRDHRSADGRAAIGVFLGRDFDFPVDVQIHAGDVGGPSAGTMFALGIYDRLTPGALAGGQRIAGTGTINVDGEVGPIGGIHQKLYGARDGGADYFLAPRRQLRRGRGPRPRRAAVVKISTFDEAVKSVQDIAAKKADSCPPARADSGTRAIRAAYAAYAGSVPRPGGLSPEAWP